MPLQVHKVAAKCLKWMPPGLVKCFHNAVMRDDATELSEDNWLSRYMGNNDILDSHQHGFNRRGAYLTNRLESLEDWSRILHGGHNLYIIFLDFQKAFDTAPIRKLKAYGIQGKLLDWLKEFLAGRRKQVAEGFRSSTWATTVVFPRDQFLVHSCSCSLSMISWS